MKRIVVISDTQIPYHDRRATENLISFIASWQPDEVVHIGDSMDFPTPSRWSKDTRAEFAGSVKRDSEEGKKFLADLRRGYDRRVLMLRSNHDDRPAQYLSQYAPALDEYADDFSISKLLDFDNFGIELVGEFYDFAPGWTMTHGHLGFSLSQIAGCTALRAAKRIGKSVVMGHTHRLGLLGESFGYAGEVTTMWGFEVGHLMDLKSANYLKNGGANWQQGFGIIYVDGEKVTPIPVPVHKDGTFTVDGYVFGK